jgi:hypothetical protein
MELYLHMYAGSSESSPQSLSKSHIHSFGMQCPFLQANSVSRSHSLLSANKIDSLLTPCYKDERKEIPGFILKINYSEQNIIKVILP